MPTYREWQQLLVLWMRQQENVSVGTEILVEACNREGVVVTADTLRKHTKGEYKNVGLEVARVTWPILCQGIQTAEEATLSWL